MLLPDIDYFDAVGNFLQGCWRLISEGVAHIGELPEVLINAAEWCNVGLSAVPEPMLAVLPCAVGGVLLFRFLRM